MKDQTLFWMLIIGVYWFFNCLIIIKEKERVVILRLGEYLKVAGPGLVFVLFPIDNAFRVDLDKSIPGWQNMPEMILAEAVKTFFLSKPYDKKDKVK